MRAIQQELLSRSIEDDGSVLRAVGGSQNKQPEAASSHCCCCIGGTGECRPDLQLTPCSIWHKASTLHPPGRHLLLAEVEVPAAKLGKLGNKALPQMLPVRTQCEITWQGEGVVRI